MRKLLSVCCMLLFRLLQCDGNINSTNSSAILLQQAQNRFIENLNAVIKNYDIKMRPNVLGPPVHVEIEMKVVSFGPVDEEKQEYDLDIVFRQWWTDALLDGAVKQPVTMAIDPESIIWKPDTYFVNARYSRFHDVTKNVMRLVLKPDGKVYYSSRISLTVTCEMDFSLFPMDKQRCPVFIESYSYTVQEVYYSWYQTNGKLAMTRGVEWIATNGPIFQLNHVRTFERHVSNNSKGAFSRLTVEFHLGRRLGYYVWNIYLPGTFLVIMTWVNFWIPSTAYPARVTISITSFLSTVLIISGAGRSLSKLSYLKAMDWFLIGSASFIFMTLVEYVLVLHCKFGHKREIDTNNHSSRSDSQQRRKRDFELSSSRDNQAITIAEHTHSNGFLKNRGNSPDATEAGSSEESSRPRNRWMVRKLLHVLKTPGERTDPVNNIKAHPIDRLSRVIFPLGYFIFMVSYAVYYQNQHNSIQ